MARIDQVHGVVEIGVVEDDVGALAAEFQADRDQVGRGGAGDDPAGGRLAGEGDPVDAGMLGQRGAGRAGAVAVQDVEHPRRQAGLQRQPGHQRRGRRGVLGRLEHHRVAPGQRRSDLPRLEHQREVPRRDRGDHAGRLEPGVGVVAAVHRQRLAGGEPGVVGEEPVVRRGARHVLATGVADRLAHVGGVGQRERVGVGLDQVGEPVQQRAALGEAHPRPRALVEGAAGGLDGAVGVLRRRPARPRRTARAATGPPRRTGRRRPTRPPARR